MKVFSKSTASILVTALLVAAGSASGGQNRPQFVPDELIIKFRDGVTLDRVTSILGDIQASTIRRFRLNPIYHVRLPEGSRARVEKALSALTEVAYVERNHLRYTDLVPNDPMAGNLWGLNNTGQTGGTPDADIDAPEAWDITTGDSNLVVAIIDSGLDMDHEDIAANLWTNPGEIPGNGIDDDGNGYVDDVHGWDFTGNDNNPDDDVPACGGHGTHTAGTVGAVGDNGTGVTGVNWNVKLMPLKAARGVLGIFCSLPDSATIAAIEYAAANGAMVSNNSYGGGSYSQAQMDTIRASRRLFVAAAGNENNNNDANPSYPASYPLNNIISVLATDHNDARASFSNYGATSVDLGAPGVNILSTLPGDQYDAYDGTSMASPLVAGVAGLLLADDPSLTPNELRWKLLNSTDNVGLPVATGGRVNVHAALTLPEPAVTIDVVPLSSTSVSPLDTISYRVSLDNTTGSSQNVDASVVAVKPDGSELTLESRNLSLGGGASVSANLSVVVPGGAPAGEYYLVGRTSVSGVSYDEDQEVYTVTR